MMKYMLTLDQSKRTDIFTYDVALDVREAGFDNQLHEIVEVTVNPTFSDIIGQAEIKRRSGEALLKIVRI